MPPPPDEGAQVRFSGKVDLSSIDAMFATTIAKVEALALRVDDRFQTLGMRMDDRLDSQDSTLTLIKEQTTKTNGSVRELKERTSALESYKSSVRNRVAGFIAAGTLVGGLVGWAIQAGLRLTFPH